MFKHILVPTDGSDLADKAAMQAIEVAKSLGSKLTFLRVMAPPAPIVIEGVVVAYPAEELRAQMKERIATHLAGLDAAAKAAGVASASTHVEHDQPWKAIIETAERVGADLVMMGSHGRKGVAALVIGSETHKVLTHTTLPVLVCR
jgi:nucleotide-binding universal stress UspA family protein